MREAMRMIAQRIGPDTARRVCVENPYRVLQGLDLLQAARRANTVVL